MSKNPNLINSVLRQQELRISTESLEGEGYKGLLEIDLTLESLVDRITTLATVSDEIAIAGGICRQQALSLESLDGVTLPFPARGFTVQPSRSGLALTQESIGKQISDGVKKLIKMLVELLDKMREHLFGGKARAEKAREDSKETRKQLTSLAAGIEGSLTDHSLLKNIRRIASLSERSDAYKAICKDLKKLREASKSLTISSNGGYNKAAFSFVWLPTIAKRHGIDLYKDGSSVPDVGALRKLLSTVFDESTIAVPGFDKDDKLVDAKAAAKFCDSHYDKAMGTVGVIELTLIEMYTHSKEIKDLVSKLQATKDVPGFSEAVADLTRLSRVCFYLVNWLNRTLTVSSELKEGV